ncbi:hypothetical protein ACFLX5_05930 [Chloroflexota bacterium]
MINIYLDTNFISELVKADRNLRNGVPNEQQYQRWESLLNVLRIGVRRNVFACPASQIQIEEAMVAGDSLLYDIYYLLKELSLGLYFREWLQILDYQLVDGLHQHFGIAQDIETVWSPFTNDRPSVTEKRTTQKIRENMANYNAPSPKASFSEQYQAERNSFLQILKADRLHQIHTGIQMHGANKKGLSYIESFFNSPNIDSVPFIHIFCSMFASFRFHEPGRTFKKGNEYADVLALSCTLPYCQIVTTDANMKTNAVNRLKLDKMYNVSLYSPRDISNLVRALYRELIRI